MANIFPRSANLLPLKIALALVIIIGGVVSGVWYYFTPKYTRVGYMPTQPVPFSHEIHANQLGMDCRYCHSNVEVSSHSNVPSTQTCMNCHSQVKSASPRLAAVRDSWETGNPVPWVRIHRAPDFVYFNHSVHVNRGVSCYSCHGQINHMPVVYHKEPQSMGWCLECHRNPENAVRPAKEIYNLDWKPEGGKTQKEIGSQLVKEWAINPPVSCTGCHR
jgi:hypothetical protein